KIAARRECRGIRFNPAPTDLYLGVRKYANKDVKQLRGDFKALRISGLVRYKKDFKPEEVLSKDAATLVLLEFVGGDATKVNDASGKNHHGMIAGAKWIQIE